MKSFHFEVRIVPPEAYPDLKDNPENPFTQISEDERLEDLVEILGFIWAEACREALRFKESISREFFRLFHIWSPKMSGLLIRTHPFWPNTMRGVFLIFIGKVHLPDARPPVFAQYYGRCFAPGIVCLIAVRVLFFGAFLPQERQASESASGLAFVRDCKSRRRLHVE